MYNAQKPFDWHFIRCRINHDVMNEHLKRWVSLLTRCSRLFMQNQGCLCSFVSICWQSLTGGKSFEVSLPGETAATGCTAGDRNNWCDWHPLWLLLRILTRASMPQPWALNSVRIVPLEYIRISVSSPWTKAPKIYATALTLKDFFPDSFYVFFSVYKICLRIEFSSHHPP